MMDDGAVQLASLTQILAWEGEGGADNIACGQDFSNPSLGGLQGGQGTAPIRREIFDENPGFEL